MDSAPEPAPAGPEEAPPALEATPKKKKKKKVTPDAGAGAGLEAPAVPEPGKEFDLSAPSNAPSPGVVN